MKTLISIILGAALSVGIAWADPVDTAENVARDTAETAKNVGKTAVRKTKQAAEAVADALTPEKGARQVNVTLTEHHVAMPTTLKKGRTAFIVRNDGRRKHNFEVQGEGIDQKFFFDVDPGKTKVLHVNLKRGSYTVFCPEDGHRKKGMELSVAVR